ncbi:hypothetical protein PtA15_3A279 [Puccinia triticina]|uniref:Uncharacterized protein n=1 Tax=Puccinia triticina TaxID=208348 RepID=A0ABY7CDY9_9BASI|nr:uncharacterized protein PtA15_3A279 [Puccinia triticina]WAQ82914.1 hypothetical protein PtA15_3A279 [Puccinia triticina]
MCLPATATGHRSLSHFAQLIIVACLCTSFINASPLPVGTAPLALIQSSHPQPVSRLSKRMYSMLAVATGAKAGTTVHDVVVGAETAKDCAFLLQSLQHCSTLTGLQSTVSGVETAKAASVIPDVADLSKLGNAQTLSSSKKFSLIFFIEPDREEALASDSKDVVDLGSDVASSGNSLDKSQKAIKPKTNKNLVQEDTGKTVASTDGKGASTPATVEKTPDQTNLKDDIDEDVFHDATHLDGEVPTGTTSEKIGSQAGLVKSDEKVVTADSAGKSALASQPKNSASADGSVAEGQFAPTVGEFTQKTANADQQPLVTEPTYLTRLKNAITGAPDAIQRIFRGILSKPIKAPPTLGETLDKPKTVGTNVATEASQVKNEPAKLTPDASPPATPKKVQFKTGPTDRKSVTNPTEAASADAVKLQDPPRSAIKKSGPANSADKVPDNTKTEPVDSAKKVPDNSKTEPVNSADKVPDNPQTGPQSNPRTTSNPTDAKVAPKASGGATNPETVATKPGKLAALRQQFSSIPFPKFQKVLNIFSKKATSVDELAKPIGPKTAEETQTWFQKMKTSAGNFKLNPFSAKQTPEAVLKPSPPPQGDPVKTTINRPTSVAENSKPTVPKETANPPTTKSGKGDVPPPNTVQSAESRPPKIQKEEAPRDAPTTEQTANPTATTAATQAASDASHVKPDSLGRPSISQRFKSLLSDMRNFFKKRFADPLKTFWRQITKIRRAGINKVRPEVGPQAAKPAA